MASYTNPKAPSASEVHHALLRPAILQILRAQGYYSSTGGTVDALTELTGNYVSAIARQTALHAAQNNEMTLSPTITDVRMALEDCGALWPERDFTAQEMRDEEDTRGVDEFIRWAKGKKNQRIRKVAGIQAPIAGEEGDEQDRETDYLSGKCIFDHYLFSLSIILLSGGKSRESSRCHSGRQANGLCSTEEEAQQG
jgi:transcription initiation factor TFIID subunit 3